MEAYLNELSLPKLNSELDVVNAFRQFGECYRQARACGITDIKISDMFFAYQFSAGYSFYNWLDDKRADKDLRTLFTSVFGTVPSVDVIFENYKTMHDRPLEMECQNQPCVGLGLSSDYIFNSVAFSLDAANWPLSNYPVSITSIIEGEDGELQEVTEIANAKNISTINHVEIHQEFINEKIANTIPNERELWLRREALFPNLKFCALVESQIEKMSSQDLEFQQIVNRLFDLQNVAIKFDGNPIKPEDFSTKTTPESASRIKKYGESLTIRCPDGQYRLFNWHSRYTPGAGRIHFYPFENDKIILVGYIGMKIL